MLGYGVAEIKRCGQNLWDYNLKIWEYKCLKIRKETAQSWLKLSACDAFLDNESFIFQQDSDPCHVAKVYKKMVSK